MSELANCRQLEDYLACELDDEARRQFELHLEQCNSCHTEVILQESIDDALRTGCNAATIPPSLNVALNRTVHQRQRRQVVIWVCCVAAAILLVIGAAVWQARLDTPAPSAPTRQQDRLVQESNHGSDPQAIAASQPDVAISFPDDKPALATRVATKDPTVTIFMVYPVHTSTPADGL